MGWIQVGMIFWGWTRLVYFWVFLMLLAKGRSLFVHFRRLYAECSWPKASTFSSAMKVECRKGTTAVVSDAFLCDSGLGLINVIFVARSLRLQYIGPLTQYHRIRTWRCLNWQHIVIIFKYSLQLSLLWKFGSIEMRENRTQIWFEAIISI